jgi:Carboxypeptidase regulatory-like domain
MSWASIRRSSIAAVLFYMVFGLALAFAQTGTTSLRGTVLDKSGATVVGAKVILTNDAQGLHREVSTDSSGAYEFPSLPPGHYSLTIEMSGFRKFEHKNLELALLARESIMPETCVNRLQDESLGQCSSRHIAKLFLKAA